MSPLNNNYLFSVKKEYEKLQKILSLQTIEDSYINESHHIYRQFLKHLDTTFKNKNMSLTKYSKHPPSSLLQINLDNINFIEEISKLEAVPTTLKETPWFIYYILYLLYLHINKYNQLDLNILVFIMQKVDRLNIVYKILSHINFYIEDLLQID